MITTDNDTFNALMDQMLEPSDRRLMIVTPKMVSGDMHKPCAVGSIIKLTPDLRAAYENSMQRMKAQLVAMETLILLCDVAEKLGVEIKEIES